MISMAKMQVNASKIVDFYAYQIKLCQFLPLSQIESAEVIYLFIYSFLFAQKWFAFRPECGAGGGRAGVGGFVAGVSGFLAGAGGAGHALTFNIPMEVQAQRKKKIGRGSI